MPTITLKNLGSSLRMLTVAAGAAVALSACTSNVSLIDRSDGGAGFREARLAEVQAVRAWRDCRDEALVLDRNARESAATARYLASAALLTKCEAELGPEADDVAIEERMQAYGLSIQNYRKGGDVAAARANLARFETTFAGYDLYYPDGSSFIETMAILLDVTDPMAVNEFAMVNVNDALKAELRRARYWSRN